MSPISESAGKSEPADHNLILLIKLYLLKWRLISD